MAQSMPPIRIIAQPKASYRERYMCEMRRNRAQRFIRAEDDNPDKYVYPTVEIPTEWLDWVNEARQVLYIRVTLVTIMNEQMNIRCIHPYRLGTEDIHVIKDPATNSLFFPVLNDELTTRRKSFQFTLQKLTLYQLKTHGPLRYLNSEKNDDQRLEDPTDARKLIETYQLRQSQLLFSIAVFQNDGQLPVIYDVSSVFAQIMTGDTTKTNDDDISFRCSPLRGDWRGSEEILMVIPKIDKRKAFTVRFVHPRIDPTCIVPLDFVDAKTISFYTPPCPVQLTKDNPTVSIPIVVIQSDIEVARVDFVYQSLERCLSCNSSFIFTKTNSPIKNKRSYSDFDETDGVELPSSSRSRVEKKEANQSNIRGFITAVRKSSSTNVEDQFGLLEIAIQQGDIDLAIKLIKQTTGYLTRENDQGQTPLLLAAQFNQSRLIRAILKKRPELAEQVDRRNNNLLHLLARVPEDKAVKTIEDVFIILDNKTKEFLISALNEDTQTPEQIAKNYDNRQYIDLLKRQIKSQDENA